MININYVIISLGSVLLLYVYNLVFSKIIDVKPKTDIKSLILIIITAFICTFNNLYNTIFILNSLLTAAIIMLLFFPFLC